MNDLALQLLHEADNKLDERVTRVEKEVEAIPTLASKVQANTEAMARMTTAIYAAGSVVISAAVLVVFLGPG